MKVLLLTIGAGRGGVVNVVWQLAMGLRRYGYETAVACDAGSELGRLEAGGIPYYPIDFKQPKRTVFGQARQLRRILAEVRPDIVHSHSRWPSLVARLAGRTIDVSTLHADRLTRHASRFDFGPARTITANWGTIVTTLDQHAREMLCARFGLDAARVVVVPNGIDDSRFGPPSEEQRNEARKKLGIDDESKTLLFVGALTEVKRPLLAIRALVGLPTTVKLLLVGDGPQRSECEQMAEQLHVSHRCRFAGWEEDPRPYYASCDLLVLPSRSEGFGLVCVEAMLCGVPVLRTRTGGWREQIIEGETGWAVPVEDEDGFCRAAAHAVQCDLRTMGQRAMEHARREFTEEVFLQRMCDVYKRALEAR